MKVQLGSAIQIISLVISIACLTLAFMVAGYWWILFTIPAMLVLWIATNKLSGSRSGSALMAVYLILAMIGALLKLQVPILLIGSIFALVAWDLNDLREDLAGQAHTDATMTLERRRLQVLAATAAISLVLTLAATSIRLRIPFGIIVLLVLLVAACLRYAVQRLADSDRTA